MTKKKTKYPAANRRASIPPLTVLRLWTLAGGRCEFLACNEYLYRDQLTQKEANFSNIAHIVAAKPGGARGDDPLPLNKRNELGNLMLVCLVHHKLIDDKSHEAEYPVTKLQSYKQAHEKRIFELTELKPENKTKLVSVRSKIGNEPVSITLQHMTDAIAPYYPVDEGLHIDISQLPVSTQSHYWSAGAETISQEVNKLFSPSIKGQGIDHLSIFGLAPMPFLIHLGACLSNKIPTDLYQKHRDTQTWVWKSDSEPVRYKIIKRQTGTDSSKVGLLLSLSGMISTERLPDAIDSTFHVYEITLEGITPTPTFLRNKADLESFRRTFQSFLSSLHKDHDGLTELHLFPAVPAPVAVVCGLDRLKKVDPTLLVYDDDKAIGKFYLTLTVN